MISSTIFVRFGMSQCWRILRVVCSVKPTQLSLVSHTMPVEAEANTMEDFENHQMSRRSVGMKEFKDAVSEACCGRV